MKDPEKALEFLAVHGRELLLVKLAGGYQVYQIQDVLVSKGFGVATSPLEAINLAEIKLSEKQTP